MAKVTYDTVHLRNARCRRRRIIRNGYRSVNAIREVLTLCGEWKPSRVVVLAGSTAHKNVADCDKCEKRTGL